MPPRGPRKLGFVFGEPVDDLFIAVTFPAGWKKVATEHSMWSDLVDPQGRKRGGIFYKAAFYDRKASMHLDRRFHCHVEPIGGYESENYREVDRICVVKDRNAIIWQSEGAKRDDYSKQGELDQLGRAWLTEHYPNWEDETAYWD